VIETTRGGALHALLAVASLCACACGAPQPPPSTMTSGRLIACHTLVAEVSSVDLAQVDEAELVRLMEAARDGEQACAPLFASEPVHPAMAAYRARQLRLRALLIELTLSTRFDHNAATCEIIRDAFAELFRSVTELNTALSAEIPAEDAVVMEQLRDLELEALDVLVTTNRDLCEGPGQ
jgi:hypothetical protein